MFAQSAFPRKAIACAFAPFAAIFLMGAAPLSYTLDTKASSITTQVPFLGIGSRSATFNTITGSVKFTPDKPADARVNVTINTQDIKAPDSLTLSRLKSEKFFWVDKYPTARFVGSNLKMTGTRTGTISGTLTARGVTRPEKLNVTFAQDPTKALGKPIGITGRMKINRKNYGMTSFNLIVGKTVTINLKARMVPS